MLARSIQLNQHLYHHLHLIRTCKIVRQLSPSCLFHSWLMQQQLRSTHTSVASQETSQTAINISYHDPISLIDLPEEFNDLDLANFLRFNSMNLSDEALVDEYEVLFTGNDETMKAKCHLICSEVNYFKSMKYRMPSKLSVKNMKELMFLRPIERQNMYEMLYKKEAKTKRKGFLKKLSQKEVEQKKVEVEENKKEPFQHMDRGIFDASGNLNYAIRGNSLFTRINAKNQRLTLERHRVAAMFGPILAIDFSFDHSLDRLNIKKNLGQIYFLYHINKYRLSSPFHLHFTDLRNDGHCWSFMKDSLRDFEKQTVVTDKSFLDVFPHDRLVYLTHCADDVYEKYDENDIIVLGGIQDNCNQKHSEATLAAIESGIRVMRLSARENSVGITQKYKYVPFNHIISILHQVRTAGLDGGDEAWNEAFISHLPQRVVKKALYQKMIKQILTKR